MSSVFFFLFCIRCWFKSEIAIICVELYRDMAPLEKRVLVVQVARNLPVSLAAQPQHHISSVSSATVASSSTPTTAASIFSEELAPLKLLNFAMDVTVQAPQGGVNKRYTSVLLISFRCAL